MTARGEIETYARELRWILDQVAISLRGLTAAQLNWRPAPTANSAWAIATHVVGSTRAYALGLGCGRAVTRARAAEFLAAGEDGDGLVGRVVELARELEAALVALPPSALDERLIPPPELWGTGEPREIVRREALVESIRHAGLHLGELRLTRDLAMQQA